MNLLVLTHPRSGHHAFIDWYCSQAGRPILHINNPEILGQANEPLTASCTSGHSYNGMDRELVDGTFKIDGSDQVINFERPDCRYAFLPWPSIIFIRDFKTYLSSVVRIAEKMEDPDLPDLSVPAWDWCYERIALGFPYVFFDQWATSKSYRLAVAKYLGIATDGQPWSRVSPFGGTLTERGSSFDGMQYDGRAHEMGVTSRDKSDSPIYQRYATQDRINANKQLQSCLTKGSSSIQQLK